MKTSSFQKCLGGTTECMRILAIYIKGFGQLTLNDTYFSDIWSSSLKTAEEAMAAGVDYCRPVKTSHKGFLSSYVIKVDEILDGRVVSCYEEYSNISWW